MCLNGHVFEILAALPPYFWKTFPKFRCRRLQKAQRGNRVGRPNDPDKQWPKTLKKNARGRTTAYGVYLCCCSSLALALRELFLRGLLARHHICKPLTNTQTNKARGQRKLKSKRKAKTRGQTNKRRKLCRERLLANDGAAADQ